MAVETNAKSVRKDLEVAEGRRLTKAFRASTFHATAQGR